MPRRERKVAQAPWYLSGKVCIDNISASTNPWDDVHRTTKVDGELNGRPIDDDIISTLRLEGRTPSAGFDYDCIGTRELDSSIEIVAIPDKKSGNVGRH